MGDSAPGANDGNDVDRGDGDDARWTEMGTACSGWGQGWRDKRRQHAMDGDVVRAGADAVLLGILRSARKQTMMRALLQKANHRWLQNPHYRWFWPPLV